MVALILIVPILATTMAIVSFAIVYWSFRGKPWKMKAWLIMSMFSWVPWAGLTIFMRIASEQDKALWLLRGSFIFLQLGFYCSYRFHHLMVFKPTDKRLTTFGLAILTGINIGLSINDNYLNTIKTTSGYYTDSFSTLLMIGNVSLGIWAGFWMLKSLNEMDAFSFFYGGDKDRNNLQILIFIGLIIGSITLLIFWLSQNIKADSTPFIIIMSFVIIFLGVTYGVNPISVILAPQRLWSFLIIDEYGLSIFEHQFSKDKLLPELTLIGMAISASNATIMANLESKTSINEISMGDRVIMIEKDEHMLYCLIADHSSIQLQILLKEAMKRICLHPSYRIPKPGDIYGKFEYVRNILRHIFESKQVSTKEN